MRLVGVSKAVTRQAGLTPQGEPAAAEQIKPSRALVVQAPGATEPPEAFLQAPFLAQLLAIKNQHPQTRERRRAEPHEAIAVYRATAALAEH